jgi:hypothetical protein
MELARSAIAPLRSGAVILCDKCQLTLTCRASSATGGEWDEGASRVRWARISNSRQRPVSTAWSYRQLTAQNRICVRRQIRMSSEISEGAKFR